MVLLLAIPWLHEVARGPAVREADPEFLELIARFYGTGQESAPVTDAGSHGLQSMTAAAGSDGAQGPTAAAPGSDGAQSAPVTDAGSHGLQSMTAAAAGSDGAQGPTAAAPGSDGAQMVRDAGNSRAAGRNVPVRFTVELNSADTACLMAVPGLGPVLSRRILRYRDLLGGYYCATQLLEVYGIDSSRYLQIVHYLSADTSMISRLDLSEGEFRDLLRHPYLDYYQVAWIFRFRESGKKPVSDDIIISPLFSRYEAERLSFYLK